MTDTSDQNGGADDFDPSDPETGGDMALAGEYALGLLTAPEGRKFEDRLMREPVLRAHYADWSERLVILSEGEDVVPPARIKAKIDTNIAPSKPVKSTGVSPFRRVLGMMTAFGILVIGVFFNPFDGVDRVEFTATFNGESGLSAQAVLDAETGQMTLARLGGATAQGRSHEVWIILPDRAPRSLGLLSAEGDFTAVWPPQVVEAVRRGTVLLAISDEALGGSTSGAPETVLATAPLQLVIS